MRYASPTHKTITSNPNLLTTQTKKKKNHKTTINTHDKARLSYNSFHSFNTSLIASSKQTFLVFKCVVYVLTMSFPPNTDPHFPQTFFPLHFIDIHLIPTVFLYTSDLSSHSPYKLFQYLSSTIFPHGLFEFPKCALSPEPPGLS